MDNSSDTVLIKKMLLISKSFTVLIFSAAIVLYYIIETILFDAKSCEAQDDSKQNFLGGATAKLWPIFHLDVAKTQKRNEN